MKKTTKEKATTKKEIPANSPAINAKPDNILLVKQAGSHAVEQMEKSYAAVSELSEMRLAAKMSNSRMSAIGRELKELIKVLRMYTI